MDHKAVFVHIPPLKGLPARPKFRMNVSFLRDKEHVFMLKKRLIFGLRGLNGGRKRTMCLYLIPILLITRCSTDWYELGLS